jgi:hypothetical protein
MFYIWPNFKLSWPRVTVRNKGELLDREKLEFASFSIKFLNKYKYLYDKNIKLMMSVNVSCILIK